MHNGLATGVTVSAPTATERYTMPKYVTLYADKMSILANQLNLLTQHVAIGGVEVVSVYAHPTRHTIEALVKVSPMGYAGNVFASVAEALEGKDGY